MAASWLCVIALTFGQGRVVGQPPGTPPPDSWIRGMLETVQPEAFLFLDESRTPVVMPRMTFEEMDRLRRLQSGAGVLESPVVMQRLTIDGSVIDQRAELSVDLTFLVQPQLSGASRDVPVVVDLAMGGLHLLDSPTVQGCPDAIIRPSDNGYQCVLPPGCLSEKQSISCRVRFRASCRVRSTGINTFSMPLSLPILPTELTVVLEPNGSQERRFNVAGVDVLGNGREVLRRINDRQTGQSPTGQPQSELAERYQVQSEGGELTLQWQRLPIQSDAGLLLDVTSISDLLWAAPTENPVLETRLQIENLRGPLRSAEIELPAGAILLRSPLATDRSPTVSSTSGQTSAAPTVPGTSSTVLETTNWTVSSGTSANRLRIERSDLPSATSSTSGVEVRLRMQLPVPEASAANPWRVQLPRVDQSIAQHGEVQVRTAEDQRLRWRPQPGVDAISVSATGLTSSGLSANGTNGSASAASGLPENTAGVSRGERTHLFRFARNQLELPVWLSSKQSQTRVRVRAALSLVRQNATVTLVLQGQDSGIDPKDLRLELGDWQLRTLEASSSESELEVTTTDTFEPKDAENDDAAKPKIVQWQVEASDGRWPSTFTIVAERSWADSLDDLKLQNGESFGVSLPKLVSVDAATLVEEVVLEVQKTGREAFVIDLPQSPGVQRLSVPGGAALASDGHAFRLLNPETDWSVQGSILHLPLEISLAGQTVTDGREGRWIWRNDWKVTSETDLEGEMTFEMPFVSGAIGSFPDASTIVWSARVNGFVGLVRAVENDPAVSTHRWQIVSPQLTRGSHRIELIGQSTEVFPTSDPLAPEDLPDTTTRDSVTDRVDSWLSLPRIVADRVDTSAGYQWLLNSKMVDPQGRIWDWEVSDESLLDGIAVLTTNGSTSTASSPDGGTRIWTLSSIPTSPIPMSRNLASTDDPLLDIPRAVIRSLVSDRSRHEHLLAAVAGGQSIQIGLVPGLKTVRVEASYDGRPIAVLRQSNGFQIDLPVGGSGTPTSSSPDNSGAAPGESREHWLDVRLWTDVSSSVWWNEIRPLMQLPVRSGWVYWDLMVAQDSHLCWAPSSIGRAMHWQPDRFRLVRQPTLTEDELQRWVAQGNLWGNTIESLNPAFGVVGNRYLFFAGDSFDFSAATVSRTSLWLFVGGIVILLSGSLQLFPQLRHPTFLLVFIVVLAGLLFVAPDVVVLLAQLTIVALLLVAVLFAISALVSPPRGDRVLRPAIVTNGGGSTRARRPRTSPSEEEPVAPVVESTRTSRDVDRQDVGSAPSSRLLVAPTATIDSKSGTSGAAR